MKDVNFDMLIPITVAVIVAIVLGMIFIPQFLGNKDMWDVNYSYDKAMVEFPGGEFQILEIEQWRDYEDGEQIQIVDTNGTVYLFNSMNVVLISE